MKSVFFLSVLILFVIVPRSKAKEQAFGLEEKTGEYLTQNLMVLNEDSVPVNLRDLVTKPTLMCFVYYHCPALCPKMLEGIAELVNFTDAIPGKDYQIFTVSIDHRESAAQAREAKKKYTGLVKKPIDPYFWRFFTADSTDIRKLTDDLGWEFRELGGDFVHTTSTVLITPGGMISQYFYGTYFNYMHFAMSVEKANKEETVPTRLKTLKYCYNYQPARNMKVVWLTTIFGITVIFISLLLFFTLVIKSRKEGA